MHSPALLFLCALGLSSVVFAGDDVAEKVAKLRLATTAVERTKLLKDNEVGIFSYLSITVLPCSHQCLSVCLRFPSQCSRRNGRSWWTYCRSIVGQLPCSDRQWHGHDDRFPRAMRLEHASYASSRNRVQLCRERHVASTIPRGKWSTLHHERCSRRFSHYFPQGCNPFRNEHWLWSVALIMFTIMTIQT